MIPVQLRRAGRGPMPSPGGHEREGRGGMLALPSSSGDGRGPPTGLGGPAPRLRLSAAQYLSGRAASRQSVHDRAAQRNAQRDQRQAFREKVSDMTGGRLSTSRSHRGFISAMGAYARRETAGGEARVSSGQHLSRPNEGSPGHGDAVKSYFDRRQARLAKYKSMRDGVTPRRADFDGHGAVEHPRAVEGQHEEEPLGEEVD